MLGKEVTTLAEIGAMGSVCIAPAGVAAYRLIDHLNEAYPELKVVCMLDSHNEDLNAAPQIRRIDHIVQEKLDYPVIVVIEREVIRTDIIDNLSQHGMKNIFWLGYNFAIEDQSKQSSDVLYFFYDLSANALNFEFLTSLAHANSVREERGLKALHPVIVPQVQGAILDLTHSALRNTGNRGDAANLWFLHNVIIPSSALVPCSQGITVCSTREEAHHIVETAEHAFPENYTVDQPIELNSHFPLKTTKGLGQPFEALETSRKLVDKWFIRQGVADKKIIVITLRKYEGHQGRNSNMDAWTCFADEIQKRGYVPVFVNDAYACFDEVGDFLVFDEATLNIFLRMSIYEAAYLNMTVNNGPLLIASLNPDVRYLAFHYVSEDDFCGSKEYYESAGEYIGYQHAWASKFQKYVWGGGDDCQAILDEFNKMCELIEADTASPSTE